MTARQQLTVPAPLPPGTRVICRHSRREAVVQPSGGMYDQFSIMYLDNRQWVRCTIDEVQVIALPEEKPSGDKGRAA